MSSDTPDAPKTAPRSDDDRNIPSGPRAHREGGGPGGPGGGGSDGPRGPREGGGGGGFDGPRGPREGGGGGGGGGGFDGPREGGYGGGRDGGGFGGREGGGFGGRGGPRGRREDRPTTVKGRLRAKARKKARKQKKQGFQRGRKVSRFGPDTPVDINYKDAKVLRGFLTETGKIIPRRISGIGAAQQRKLAVAIKRARHLAMLPYSDSHQ